MRALQFINLCRYASVFKIVGSVGFLFQKPKCSYVVIRMRLGSLSNLNKPIFGKVFVGLNEDIDSVFLGVGHTVIRV